MGSAYYPLGTPVHYTNMTHGLHKCIAGRKTVKDIGRGVSSANPPTTPRLVLRGLVNTITYACQA